MKRMLAAGALFVMIWLDPEAARAADIGAITLQASTCNSLTIKAHIGSGWQPSPNPNNKTYKLYRVADSTTIYQMAATDSDTIHLSNLQAWTPYYVYVEARTRRAGGWGIPLYRKVGELTAVTPQCTAASTSTPQPGDVRLRHETTGKCLYGSPTEGGVAGTFTCWNDPEMAVSLEPVNQSGTEVRLRIRARGKCLFGNPTQGGVARNHTCWNDPNMVFVKDHVSGNRWRLRHKNTGNCIYTGTNNGDPVRNFTCWEDPAMVWIIDPF